ncbi:ABC transporter permease [Nocardioides daeguensis]|uniref:ABC transporter permease n=1 Tax=Nocardioides daeguensis TaxID=908359 RepID=A0ABP6WNW6_9ACTN|nr:ABC transporter permease [Nocardioides daeguensis]MBV6729573.1 ABC transporter permease [Nocardioides daeguensis]MCR1775005.1 ABC transporter permease [Nocardioides daeguensis]
MTATTPDEAGLPPLQPPSSDNGLIGVLRRRYLLKLLVRREISARYQGSFLGLIWSYINPLTQFCIYYFVVGFIFNLHADIPNFAIHLFAGLTVVHFFTETFGAGTRSIVRNRALVVKMAMPREMFPVATMLVSLYHVIPQVVILMVASLLSGWTPEPVDLVAFLLGLLICGLLGLAGALFFSAANVFFSDFGNIVGVFNNFVRWGVPMMYSYAMVDQRFGDFAKYYLYNPLADAVLLFQRAFWVGTVDDPDHQAVAAMPEHLLLNGALIVVIAALVLGVAQFVFSRLENKIPERL